MVRADRRWTKTETGMNHLKNRLMKTGIQWNRLKMKMAILWHHQRMDRKEDKYFTVAEIAAVFLWEHMKPILTNEIPAFIFHIL